MCQDDEHLLHVYGDASHVEDLHRTCDIFDLLGASLESVSMLTCIRSIPAFDDELKHGIAKALKTPLRLFCYPDMFLGLL